MMSIETIRAIGGDAGRRARQMNLRPKQFAGGDEVAGIPNFGNWRPPGWRLVAYHFCDKGWGDDGRSMSIDALTEMIKGKPDRGFAMIEEGQFQCHVGEFVRDKSVANGSMQDFRTDISDDEVERTGPFSWRLIA